MLQRTRIERMISFLELKSRTTTRHGFVENPFYAAQSKFSPRRVKKTICDGIGNDRDNDSHRASSKLIKNQYLFGF